MYIKKKVGKKRSFTRRHMAEFVILLCACASMFAAVSVNKILNNFDGLLAFNTEAGILPELDGQAYAANERVVYPYSIIPGGAHSQEELAANVRADDVVAAHYADFNVDKARVFRATETLYAHVSYRLKNKVYWTSKKLKIPAGETLITDGTCIARTRCGNRVSAEPQEPTSPDEPITEAFDVPQVAGLELPQLEPIPGPGLLVAMTPFTDVPVPGRRLVPLTPPILPYYRRPILVPGRDVPPWPVDAVPEPGTWVLVVSGLAAVVGARLRLKKK